MIFSLTMIRGRWVNGYTSYIDGLMDNISLYSLICSREGRSDVFHERKAPG